MHDITIGDYNLIPEDIPAEGDVYIKLKPIDLISYWKRCGLLANFAAAFYTYPQEGSDSRENSISTVFNELIENATKYSVKRGAEVSIHMMLFDQILKIQIDNITTEHHYRNFHKFLEKLFNTADLDQLYVETLAAKSESTEGSGIGLLLLLKDYPLRMGARLISSESKFKVSIQVFYNFHADENI